MTDLATINIRSPLLAKDPPPTLFVSWFLSFPLSWVRKKARHYYDDEISIFRRKEQFAIRDARGVVSTVEKSLRIDSSPLSLRDRLHYLDTMNARMCEQIRTFPEVEHILTSIYNKVLDFLKPKPKAVQKEFYAPVFAKLKAEPVETEDFSSGIEVRLEMR